MTMPVCRRIVLLRKSDVISFEEFNNIEQEYFSRKKENLNRSEQIICEYLINEPTSVLKCTTFQKDHIMGVENLLYEKEWLEKRKEEFPKMKVNLDEINQIVRNKDV
jgi:hypothetical protein